MTTLHCLLLLKYRTPKRYDALMKYFWPESLTSLFPNTAGNPTVAIRILHCTRLQGPRLQLLSADVPLVTSSPNSSGSPIPMKVGRIYGDLDDKVRLFSTEDPVQSALKPR